MNYFSITSQIIVNEAKSLGFEVEILEPSKNFYVIKGNGKEIYFKNNDFGGNSSLGYKIADDKELSNIVLERKGYRVPKSIYLKKEEVESFNLSTTNLEFPLVTKPVDEGHGNGVTTGIETTDELNKGIDIAFNYGDKIIIQEFIEGDEHRLLVIGDKVVVGVRRIPASVIGDGIHSILELIEIENKNPLRGEGYEKPMSYIKVDENLTRYIGKKGLKIDYIPKNAEIIKLRGISNIGAGGNMLDVSDLIGEDIRKECVSIAKIVGLQVVGIDVITTDLGKSLNESKGAIIEINATPGFGYSEEISSKIVKEYLKHVFNI